MKYAKIVQHLDTAADAARPAAAWHVWEAAGHDRVARVLSLVLSDGVNASAAWYLQVPAGTQANDLGPGAWVAAADAQFVVPSDIDAQQFVASPLHASGNYAIYQRSGGVLPGGLPRELPWWGLPSWARARERWSAEALVAGLRRANIGVAVAVHPDASAVVVAIAEPE